MSETPPPQRGLVWQAIDAIKTATTTPEAERGDPKPMTVRDIIRENRRLLDRALLELEYERNQCVVERKRAEVDGKKHLQNGDRFMARMSAENSRALRDQLQRIEQAKYTIRNNGQMLNEFSTTTTITQVIASIARTMELVNQGPASGARLKLIAAELARQNQLVEVQRRTLDSAINPADSLAASEESTDAIMSEWERSMVLSAPRPPGGGGGGGSGTHTPPVSQETLLNGGVR